jgi:hypothetical protein
MIWTSVYNVTESTGMTSEDYRIVVKLGIY